MQLHFSSPGLRGLAQSSAELVLELGEACAEDAMAALCDLRAIGNLDEMRSLPGSCRQTGDLFVISLVGGGGIVLKAVRTRPKPAARRVVSWHLVRAVEICAITADLASFDAGALSQKVRGGVPR